MAVVVSAVVTAFEVATVAAALTAVAEVGLAFTVVGAATGSKDLLKAGKVLGIVGGVGSLVNAGFGALAEGAAEGAAGAIADSAADGAFNFAGSATDSVGNAITDSLAQASPIDMAGLSSINNQAGALSSAASESAPAALDSSIAGLGDASADSTVGALNTAPSTPSITQTAPTISAPSDSGLSSYGENLDIQNVGDKVGSSVADGVKSPADGFLAKADDFWNKLGPQGKAEALKSLMAIPGGIQKQKNDERMLAIQKQNADANTNRVNQTSYGNQVVGIINKAKVG